MKRNKVDGCSWNLPMQASEKPGAASVEVAPRAAAIRLCLPGGCGSAASSEGNKGLLLCPRKKLGIQK